jgi:hypothetical protein
MIVASPIAPADALSLLLRLGSVGVAISSLELLTHRADLARGLLDAEAQVTRSRGLVRHPRMSSRLGRADTAVVLVATRLLAAAALVAGAGIFEVARVGAVAVAATTLLLRLRSPIGMHASGGMVMVTFTAAALGLAVGTAQAVGFALAFIGGQACFAYLVAGSRKLQEPLWRDGRAVPLISSNLMWGARRQAVALRAHPRLGSTLGWATMLGECSVPLALVAPLPVALAILGCAMLFHLGVAVQMGLNSFVWAFGSTYPAIIFCNYWIRAHL